MGLTLDREYLRGFVGDPDIRSAAASVAKAHDDLKNKTGKGSGNFIWN